MREVIADEAPRDESGHRTYRETVAAGFYGRPVGGLRGKFDNVRTFWEDQLTRLVVRGVLKQRAEATAAEGREVRILDLGSGSGQGYELLTRIYEIESLRDDPTLILPEERIGLYLGLDLSPAMVEQGDRNFADRFEVHFEQADLREGLGPAQAEAPFDIYFSSYGAMSHLSAEDVEKLLGRIARHAMPGSGIVLDLVGRRSLEWPGYWDARDEAEKVRPYSMSYLYEEAEREKGSIERFPLRFWTGEEVRGLVERVSAAAGVELELVELADRSLLVGRHVDTREYGCELPPLRGLVNRLYEQNLRTPIERLVVPPLAAEAHRELGGFFAALCRAWNQVVGFTLDRLDGRRVRLVSLPGWSDAPPALQLALMTIDRIVDSVAWMDVGDVRANVIEPQLAYVLRRLEHALQPGRGCGHGLLAVLRVTGPR